MEKNPTPKKLSRAQITQALDTVPVATLLGRSTARELTPKQRRFAKEVAKGATKADAYRAAYDVTSAHTMKSKPYELAKDARIQAEITAYQVALETAEHRTPGALRALVVQSLAQILVDPDAKHAVRVQAAKVLGTVTEVAAFTERREVRTISTSEDARAKLMAEIKELAKAQAIDAEIIERDADSLMRELAADDPHPTPTPHDAERDSGPETHTIPHEQPHIPHEQSQLDPEDPTPLPQEDPPGDGT